MVGVCRGSTGRYVRRLTHRGFSNIPPDFIAIVDALLWVGRHVEPGGRIIPSVSPYGARSWRTYFGTRVIENG